MEKIKIDLTARGGQIKVMNAVNNGPVGVDVRNPNRNNIELFREAEIPFARNHDASFCRLYGGEHTVDVHRIFKNFDADENDPASYWFEPTDSYVKNCLSVGTMPFYRLGASIEHEFKYGTRVPKDFAKWARICEHIIRHYNEGWADGYQFGIEYWEIWNEPDCRNFDGSNPCWQGTEEEFVELYCVTAKHLKAQFPHLKIGGPAFCTPEMNEFKEKFFKGVKESGAPLDFYSYHRYAYDLGYFGDTMTMVRDYLDEYGFQDSETILNEWNYIKGWLDEEWKYSLDMELGLKGSSFIAGAMALGQSLPLDMLMYYDAQPGNMNGIFDDEFNPRKGYFCYTMFRDLKKLGTQIPTDFHVNDFYNVAATDGKQAAVMMTCYNDDDSKAPQDVCLEFTGADSLAADTALKVSCYVLDEEHNYEPVREEIFTAAEFKICLKMSLFSTWMIKVEPM